MFKGVLAGFALAAAISGAALAATPGPLSISTAFPAPIPGADPFHDNLASIGVGTEMAFPVTINLFAPTNLEFRLLESRADPSGAPLITALTVGSDTFDFGLQAFAHPGSLLGTVLFSGSLSNALGFRIFGMDDIEPPIGFPNGFRVSILSADEAGFTGIGPFIGSVDRLYLSLGEGALVEVSVAGVPEPAAWALMIGGFALVGMAIRRRRGAPGTPWACPIG